MKPYEIEGSIAGFEACRDANVDSPDALAELLDKVRGEINEAFHISHERGMSLSDYWRIRYKEIQIDYVFQVMKFAWIQSGYDITSVSASAAVKFHQIISK